MASDPRQGRVKIGVPLGEDAAGVCAGAHIRASGGLRIEVVDTTRNRAANGMRVDVFALGARARKLCAGVVNAEGVVDAPVLATAAIAPGEYEVVFYVGAYFGDDVSAQAGLPALDTVSFRFAITGTQRYLVPVQVAPWAFSLVRPRRSAAERMKR